jgi:hypothetical protein
MPRPKPVPRRISQKQVPAHEKEPEPSVQDPTPLLKQAFDIAVQEDGWAFLGTLGHHLRQLDPGFDARTYGHSQLSALVRANTKLFDIREEKGDEGNSVIYVRLKDYKPA